MLMCCVKLYFLSLGVCRNANTPFLSYIHACICILHNIHFELPLQIFNLKFVFIVFFFQLSHISQFIAFLLNFFSSLFLLSLYQMYRYACYLELQRLRLLHNRYLKYENEQMRKVFRGGKFSLDFEHYHVTSLQYWIECCGMRWNIQWHIRTPKPAMTILYRKYV